MRLRRGFEGLHQPALTEKKGWPASMQEVFKGLTIQISVQKGSGWLLHREAGTQAGHGVET